MTSMREQIEAKLTQRERGYIERLEMARRILEEADKSGVVDWFRTRQILESLAKYDEYA